MLRGVISESMPATCFSYAERLGREADDQVAPVVRILAPDLDLRAFDVDDVVTGPRVAAQAKRRDGAGVDDEHVLEPPRVRHVLVAAEHEVDAGAQQALDRIARVVDDVPLATGPRHRQQVVVEDEDAERGRPRELLLDPRIAAAADLAVVEVGLGRVDGDDGHAPDVQHRAAVAEHLLEVDVADVARVVVARDDHERLALDLVQVGLGLDVLGLEAERGQVAGADDEVRLHVVDLADRPLEQRRDEVRPPAVQVGDVGDPERAVRGARHGRKCRDPVRRGVTRRSGRRSRRTSRADSARSGCGSRPPPTSRSRSSRGMYVRP